MLKETRKYRIRNLVEERGQITVSELNEWLQVSEATIRRDLDEMSELGWVRRTHGGAVAVQRSERERPLVERSTELLDEKSRICAAAATRIHSGDRVFLGSGTTVARLPQHMADIDGLTVITNSLPVVTQLAERTDLELIVIGGLFRHTERSMVSEVAARMISEFRVDTVFLGIRGVDPMYGFTSDAIDEAASDRAMLQIAPERVVLADHTKFGKVSTVALAPISAVQTIITDGGIDAATVARFGETGVDLVVAP